MKQTNLQWIKANAYNLEFLRQLISRVHDAVETTDVIHLGWVTDDPNQDGIITATGYVSVAELPYDTNFLYDLGALADVERRMQQEVDGDVVLLPPAAGSTIMATVATESCKRGDVGVVLDGITPFWPNLFGVRWAATGDVSYLRTNEYVDVRVG